MKHLLLLALLGSLSSTSAHATDPSTCYTISDADARAFCLAKAHNAPSRCYAIQDSSKRAECLAEVRK